MKTRRKIPYRTDYFDGFYDEGFVYGLLECDKCGYVWNEEEDKCDRCEVLN